MRYIFMGFGTVGKTIAHLLDMLLLLYRRNGLPIVSFDSDKSTLINFPMTAGNHQICLSFDGHDVAEAMKRGKFSALRFINSSLLKSYEQSSAMGLLPFMGNMGRTVHKLP